MAFSFSLARRHRLAAAAAAALLSALLAACGGGGSDAADDDDGPVFIDTAGRLAVAENGAPALRLHDLDTATLAATSFALDNPASALYASPGGRYAVAPQRSFDRVQFVDGGVWQEDHVDHLHDYKEAPKTMAWKLTGPRPTHYDVQIGKQAAFFFDGNSAATPAQNAAIRVFTDASIATGSTTAGMDLSASIHGLGEPVDDKLLTVHREADAPDTLPTHLQLYTKSGSGYNLVRRLDSRCDGMHGSYSSGSYTVAGCIGGALLVKHTGAATVTDSKLTAPIRIGTIAGHVKAPGQFIGIGNDGAAPAPVTTRFFAINGDAATLTEVVPQDWTTGRQRRAHAFDRSGTKLFILDDQGTLTTLQLQSGAWTTASRRTGVVPTMPAAAPWPAITANGARDVVYITDPSARQLITVNTATSEVAGRVDLGYVPSAAAWLGITR